MNEQENASKTRDEKIKELLDSQSAASVLGSIKGPNLGDGLQQEPNGEDAPVSDLDEEDTESGGKKVRIPASRLKTLTSELKELREQVQSANSYAERVAALERQITESRSKEEELPEWWKEAYGDNDISKQGYKNQQRIFREEMTREFERREAERAAEEAERTEKIEAIEESFDEQMDELEESVGRTLTTTQKSELLDIIAEYSPQEDGKYVAYIPVEKAYDIWQKNQVMGKSKQEIARIAGSQSSGGIENSHSTETPQWGSWRKRFGG